MGVSEFVRGVRRVTNRFAFISILVAQAGCLAAGLTFHHLYVASAVAHAAADDARAGLAHQLPQLDGAIEGAASRRCTAKLMPGGQSWPPGAPRPARQITSFCSIATGAWPLAMAGPIKEAPGETWAAVAVALDHGQRGLPGGSSIAKLLAKQRGVRNRAAVPDFSINRILRWADAHKARTGNWPIIEGGPIRESPGDTWNALHHALSRGTRRLPGGSSLARLLLEHRGVRRHFRHPPLSLKQILCWADAHRKRTGGWPKAESGPIPESNGETWYRVQNALYEEKRGLPQGWSLAKILAKHRGVRNHLDLPRLSEALILRWAKDHLRRTGQLPSRNSGPIPKSNGENWGRRRWRIESWRSWTAGRIVAGTAYCQKPQEGADQG